MIRWLRRLFSGRVTDVGPWEIDFPRLAPLETPLFDRIERQPATGIVYDYRNYRKTGFPSPAGLPSHDWSSLFPAEPAPPGTCDLPPAGWYCSLGSGHQGPCPTWPVLVSLSADARLLTLHGDAFGHLGLGKPCACACHKRTCTKCPNGGSRDPLD